MITYKIQLLIILAFLFLSENIIAQKTETYKEDWKKVDNAESKGLTKTAWTEVNSIYKKALKDNNDAQSIKACMYILKYKSQIEEDSKENNIFYLDTLIQNAKAPVKNIFQSIQAEIFWFYLQQNRWKFYNRTALAEEKSNDITTWSLEKLHATIAKLYFESLNNGDLLKHSDIGKFDPILILGDSTRSLHPTLYDFLVFRALEYFTNVETDLTKPTYQFTLKDEMIYAPAEKFVAATFTTKDTASLHFKALLLFQDILRFHLNDKDPNALLDADLARLEFVNQYAVLINKENFYEAALQHIENKYPDNKFTAKAMYLRSKIYFDKGQEYAAETNPINQYEIKRAKELCEKAVSKFPASEGGILSYNLINKINIPSLNLQTEKVNVPKQPFRTLVQYKNVPVLYVRIIKTSRDELKKIEKLRLKNDASDLNLLTSLIPVATQIIKLPDLNDYQQHSTEIKIGPLENGQYIMLTSMNPDFYLEKNIISSQSFTVSNISYINHDRDCYILEREEGLPIENAKIQVWENYYDPNISDYTLIKQEEYLSDKNGHFTLNQPLKYKDLILQINTTNDELFLNDAFEYGFYNSHKEPQVRPISFLFTDRSIYRPGQIVFFKGIVVKRTDDINKDSIWPAFKAHVVLKDANRQTIKDLFLTTNEYGSYNGSFKIPEGILNGEFSIFDSLGSGSQKFKVEEYKRPSFLTEIQKPSGTYRLFDTIQVTGTAKAYSGINIDGAKVVFRVVRRIIYQPWWEGIYGRMYNSNAEMEISHGETTTNEHGEFNIQFKAIPDETVDKKTQPIFQYEVSADVTDINGETRSAQTMVAVAYQALQLKIYMPDKIIADSLKSIFISSKNMNDILEKSLVHISISKVQSPDRIYRQRLWQTPDLFVMSKDEYYNNFPYDVYKDEDKIYNWKTSNSIIDLNDSSNGRLSKLNSEKINSISSFGEDRDGSWYKLTATTRDKYGEDINAEKYFQIEDYQHNTETYVPINFTTKKRILEPSEKIEYSIKTGFDQIWLIHCLKKMNTPETASIQHIRRLAQFENSIPVTENDRGGIIINYAFVKHNRIYNGNQYFYIPWSNKELKISYATFRDKILPGSKEKYTLTISGSNSEKLSAEVLACMYDKSLDQLQVHHWNPMYIWPLNYYHSNSSSTNFGYVGSLALNQWNVSDKHFDDSYDELLFAREYEIYASATRLMNIATFSNTTISSREIGDDIAKLKRDSKDEGQNTLDAVRLGSMITKRTTNDNIQIRKNFNETAFFYPDLKTDEAGNVSFSFTIPEALTKWKFLTFAHTKDLRSGYTEDSVVTQKPLMIQANAPRFLREGDQMEFSAKVSNLNDNELTGTATLELMNAANNQSVNDWFKNNAATQKFTVAAGQSVSVKFPIEIPLNFNSALSYRIVAKTNEFSDGEEMVLPVLTNRTLVTESMPLNLRNTTHKEFKFKKLIDSKSSGSLKNHALTVEYTCNPVWYAVQALPYLMEYPYECAEQTFNRYFANTLAAHICSTTPIIKSVFENWKNTDTAALLSNLEKNEELKSALLQETPWVLDAKNESNQKKNIALLFDLVRLGTEGDKAINKLKEMQISNGGFVWFKGGPDDRYITQYIITGIGHLRKLNALSDAEYSKLKMIVDKAIPYLDKKINDDYNELILHKVNMKSNNLYSTAIQYLYMRSFFEDYPIPRNTKKAFTYYREQSKKYWLKNSRYMQAMIALALHRTDNIIIANAIIKSLKENSINNEEMGMYWKEWNQRGFYWYESPIESQALMIEAFADIDKNDATLVDLKTWLLKQKQTQNWGTTKATAEACYALLLDKNNGLDVEQNISIKLGDTSINSIDNKTETATGYFKKRIEGENVKAAMGNISVDISTPKPLSASTSSWGSVYWQYFEDLDKISSASTPLSINKKLFVEKNSDKGPILQAINDGDHIQVGDKIITRIELKVDRNMEYIQLKDMRAACMEPVNVISQCKWQGGLGYYESTKDACTNFFFAQLPRGTYVFEYPMFVTHSGNFSNGISNIQCMYAPEFTSHSEGIRVNVK